MKCYLCEDNEATQKILDRNLCDDCASMGSESINKAKKLNFLEDFLKELKQKRSGMWSRLVSRCKSSKGFTTLIIILWFAIVLLVCIDWSGW